MDVKPLVAWLRAAVALILVSCNTLLHVVPLLAAAVLKLLLPFKAPRAALDQMLMRIAESWIGFNSGLIDRLTETRISVEGLPEPQLDGHLLVISNHQSWVDIPVLQKLFNRRLPLLRFFLKAQLIWVPLLGLAWWALDFPFMKRYSREQLARRPELAGRDIEATRRACRKFRDLPVAIMNFVEGTRYTNEKRLQQNSPYRHLLKPRGGGIAFVLDAMAESIDTVVDVTIAYPGFDVRPPGLLDLCANRISEVRVLIRTEPVLQNLRGLDYQANEQDRARFQDWLNALWMRKDRDMERLLRASGD